jgi:hypothetical protein
MPGLYGQILCYPFWQSGLRLAFICKLNLNFGKPSREFESHPPISAVPQKTIWLN